MIIGLAGRASSGKDTVGAFIFSSNPEKYAVMAFATPLKEIVKEVYDFSDLQIYGPLKETPDPRYLRPDGTCLTPREAMQKCGTEWARSCYPDTWAAMGIRRAKREWQDHITVIFTDCRFTNEAKAIIDAGGEVWRIHRKLVDDKPATHASEWEMDTAQFEKLVKNRIYNNGTLDELQGQALSHLR